MTKDELLLLLQKSALDLNYQRDIKAGECNSELRAAYLSGKAERLA